MVLAKCVEMTGLRVMVRRAALTMVILQLMVTVALPSLERRSPVRQLGHGHLFAGEGDFGSHTHDEATANGVLSLHEHPGQQEMVPTLSGQLALPASAVLLALPGTLAWLTALQWHYPAVVFMALSINPLSKHDQQICLVRWRLTACLSWETVSQRINIPLASALPMPMRRHTEGKSQSTLELRN